jgi:hypothetical protein
MGMGHCTAGSAERRSLKIVVPRLKPYTPDQIYNRSERGLERHRRYNNAEKGRARSRKRHENKENKT